MKTKEWSKFYSDLDVKIREAEKAIVEAEKLLQRENLEPLKVVLNHSESRYFDRFLSKLEKGRIN